MRLPRERDEGRTARNTSDRGGQKGEGLSENLSGNDQEAGGSIMEASTRGQGGTR